MCVYIVLRYQNLNVLCIQRARISPSLQSRADDSGHTKCGDTHQPCLVLLDCGIATSLTHFDLLQMRALFTAIVKGDVS